MFDYSQFLEPVQPNDTPSGSDDPPTQPEGPEESNGKDKRICSVTFNNVIREEHRAPQHDKLILERIESAQLSMTKMVREIYTVVHMATLLVSGYQLYVVLNILRWICT